MPGSSVHWEGSGPHPQLCARLSCVLLGSPCCCLLRGFTARTAESWAWPAVWLARTPPPCATVAGVIPGQGLHEHQPLTRQQVGPHTSVCL